SKLLGVGIVDSNYQYDQSRPEYRHVRRVKWLRAANVDLPENLWLGTKTLTKVTKYPDFVTFVTEKLIEPPEAPIEVADASPITVAEALADLFLPRADFDSILAAMRRKKNVLLQGAPGVGKTFIARRIAYALLEQKDKSRVAMVQFHQSYAYEDFIQG